MFGIRSAVLRAPTEGDQGHAGGDDAKPMTQAEIQALIGTTVNSAVSSHLKRALAPSIAEALKGVAWGDILKPEIEKLKPAIETPAGGGDQKADPKLAVFEAKLAEALKTIDTERTARVAAENKARDDKAFSDLRTALTGHVRPEALDQAARLLFHADKRVTFDEEGRAQLTVRRNINGIDEDAAMPLADGAQFWAKSKEGAIFAPPPDTHEAGKRGAPGRQVTTRNGMPVYDKPATTEEEKLRRSFERETALENTFKNLT